MISLNQKLIKQLEGIYNIATEPRLYIDEHSEVDDNLLIALGEIAQIVHAAMREYQLGKGMKKPDGV